MNASPLPRGESRCDRDRRGRIFRGPDRRGATFIDDHVNFARDEFRGQRRQALVLAFSLGSLNPLQTRLVLAVLSLSGGLIATEIPGLLHANVTFGQKIGIVAGGAIAVFIILFLTVPA